MFGYIRPWRPELKCKDFDLYNAYYCGLCRTLRQRSGLIAPMFLNYEFTFLALLLSEEQPPFQPCKGRCHANPLLKRDMCEKSATLDFAADGSVILTQWKLRDSVQDDGLIQGLPSRGLSAAMHSQYKKAADRMTAFDKLTGQCIAELSELERTNCTSIDQTADAFARILRGLIPSETEAARRRALEQLLYQIGRWIYLIDARDDLEEDRAHHRYNPLLTRYGAQGDDENLKRTLEHSLNLARSAFHLLRENACTPVIENILYLGLPMVQRAVFDGSWKEINKQKIWSNKG